MIIQLHDDIKTRDSANSLSKRYGEEVRTHTNLLRENHELDPKTEIPIRRITFLGHADELHNYGPYDSPAAFVGFVHNVLENNQESLQDLKTIDLFGCRVGQVVNGQSFTSQVSQGLSDLGHHLEIRAFSHPNSTEYNRTLLQEAQGNWRYVGIRTEEDYQSYSKLKKEIDLDGSSVGIAKARVSGHLNTCKKKQSAIGEAVKRGADEQEITRLTTERQEADASVVAVTAKLETLKAKFSGTAPGARATMNTLFANNTIIMSGEHGPRATLDELPYCQFDNLPAVVEASRVSGDATVHNPQVVLQPITGTTASPEVVISQPNERQGSDHPKEQQAPVQQERDTDPSGPCGGCNIS